MMPSKRQTPRPKTPPPPCPAGQCVAGHIGSKEIRVQDWAVELLKFEGKVELWNEVTKHHAVPHMGYVKPYKFCILCGTQIDTGYTLGAAPELQLSADLSQILSLSEGQLAQQADQLRNAGVKVPIEPVEQRVSVQHWLLRLYLSHGCNWRSKSELLIPDLAAPLQEP